ncbi:amidase family protein [Corynebacterium cystitidis]|uniref:amidase family protein n=1 Tax=Corynebacterium cystitidis TaxID=35757 RepID=UPI00211DE733|nr:amidase family protein [Corynebacterium cystitidis]
MTTFPTTATDWVTQTRSGEFSARAGIEHTLRTIHARNPEFNAFERTFDDHALKAADQIDQLSDDQRGPLHGLPVAVKAELPIAGVPTTYGTAAVTTPAAHDCEVVRRLRDAGAIIVGTTTMPEFGALPVTSSASNGVTRNPLNPSYTPGGSSGGSAAAVVSGMVPVAIGSDGGGSIRIPSAYTGLIGLKPTRGRVSSTPYPNAWGELGTTGPLTRTPEDSELIYSVISPSFAALDDELPKHPRFLTFVDSPTPVVRTVAENRRAVTAFSQGLRSIGSVAEAQRRLPNPIVTFTPHFWNEIAKEAATVDHPRRLENRTRTITRFGHIARRMKLLRPFDAYSALIDDLFTEADFLVTPTTACRPPLADQYVDRGAVVSQLMSAPAVAFTAMFNISGHPAVSVPAGVGTDGLPLAVQIVGKHDTERQLLALARGDAPQYR